MIMAEGNNYAAISQTKDLLSAALGQSGLHFEESEDESIQDVFAALAADGGILLDRPRRPAPQNATYTASNSQLGGTGNAYDKELEELMGLLDNGIEKYHNSQPNDEILVDSKQHCEPNRPEICEDKRLGSNLSNPILILDESDETSDDRIVGNYDNYKKSKEIRKSKLQNPALFAYGQADGWEYSQNAFDDLGLPYNNTTVQFSNGLSVSLKIPPAADKNSSENKFMMPSMGAENDVEDKTQPEEDDVEEEEELGYADTFADYMPSKVKIGKKHPDPVVETSSMASVPPPDVWYSLSLPEEVAERRLLSALQLEAIIYSCQQHEKLLPNGKRAGFLIGDGAGVGKGRTVAGIIYENYILGRKRAIWLSVSNDLRFDALRDLRDIGCNMSVNALNKFKYDEKISSRANGKVKKGVIFSTYSSLIGETQGTARFKTRLSQLLHWCGEDFDGVIILDECHKAKNLVPTGSGKPTKTGLAVVQLQNMLPKARVVYCSATGASEPRNMAYMNRLGIWGTGTPFKEFSDFIQSVEKRGVGAMEMVAMDMKLRGMYIARQLSFAGTSFSVQEISLSQKFIDMYNASVKLWAEAREKFEKASELLNLDGGSRKTMWGQFWSAHQRFFKYLCIAAKVKEVVNIAKEAVDLGKCVVIGLQSTGEARTVDQLDELGGDLNDFVSTAKGVLSNLVEKQFPVVSNSKYSDKISPSYRFDWNNKKGSTDRKRKHALHDPVRHKRRKQEDTDTIIVDSDSESNLGSQNDVDGVSQDDLSDAEEQAKSASFESNSESDDDNWLKALSDKPKSRKSSKKKMNSSTENPDSLSVLDAAGLTGRQFSWVRNSSRDSQPFKSNRVAKTDNSFDLLRQISTSSPISSSLPAAEQCSLMKNELIEKIDIVAQHLPPNTLDELIDELGGPDHVAEMTGRKGRVLAKQDGSFIYESRSKDDVPLELLNIAEKERFMAGEKLVAIISEAASSGISLQADRRVKNQCRRLHITLELPWSADKAIQQFGRTHRSNQVSAPEYLFLISELAGEQRFASIVAKRLESLGALTHGDRRATESRDLSRFNFDTKYGRSSLEIVFKSVVGMEKPLVNFPENFEGNFLEDICEGLIGVGMVIRGPQNSFIATEKDYSKVARFLNRILGLSVACQNALFTYFIDTMNSIIKEAKRNGKWDEGILDLGSQGELVKKLDVRSFSCPSSGGLVTTDLLTVSVERGLSWEKAYDIFRSCNHAEEGFYSSNQTRIGKRIAILVTRAMSTSKKKMYCIQRANIGLQSKQEQLTDIKQKYEKITVVEAEELWKHQYSFSENSCTHEYWRGKCKKKAFGLNCEVGMRKRTCYVLSGSVLSVWTKLEGIFSTHSGASGKMQIIRLRLDDGTKIVGALVPANLVDLLIRTLSVTKNEPNSILNLL